MSVTNSPSLFLNFRSKIQPNFLVFFVRIRLIELSQAQRTLKLRRELLIKKRHYTAGGSNSYNSNKKSNASPRSPSLHRTPISSTACKKILKRIEARLASLPLQSLPSSSSSSSVNEVDISLSFAKLQFAQDKSSFFSRVTRLVTRLDAKLTAYADAVALKLPHTKRLNASRTDLRKSIKATTLLKAFARNSIESGKLSCGGKLNSSSVALPVTTLRSKSNIMNSSSSRRNENIPSSKNNDRNIPHWGYGGGIISPQKKKRKMRGNSSGLTTTNNINDGAAAAALTRALDVTLTSSLTCTPAGLASAFAHLLSQPLATSLLTKDDAFILHSLGEWNHFLIRT